MIQYHAAMKNNFAEVYFLTWKILLSKREVIEYQVNYTEIYMFMCRGYIINVFLLVLYHSFSKYFLYKSFSSFKESPLSKILPYNCIHKGFCLTL